MFAQLKSEHVAMGLSVFAYVASGLVVLVTTATVASRASLARRATVARTAIAGVVWGVMIAATPFVLLGVIWTQLEQDARPVRAAAMLAGLFAPVVLARLVAIVALSTPEPRP